MLHMKWVIARHAASTHTNTHIHRLPFKGQCLCECAGTAGLWYVSGPRPWDTQGRACHRMWGRVWCWSFPHSPTDAGTRDNTTHTFFKEGYRKCTYNATERWWKHMRPHLHNSFIHKHDNTPKPSVISHLGAAQTQGLMNLFWIPSPLDRNCIPSLENSG